MIFPLNDGTCEIREEWPESTTETSNRKITETLKVSKNDKKPLIRLENNIRLDKNIRSSQKNNVFKSSKIIENDHSQNNESSINLEDFLEYEIDMNEVKYHKIIPRFFEIIYLILDYQALSCKTSG